MQKVTHKIYKQSNCILIFFFYFELYFGNKVIVNNDHFGNNIFFIFRYVKKF